MKFNHNEIRAALKEQKQKELESLRARDKAIEYNKANYAGTRLAEENDKVKTHHDNYISETRKVIKDGIEDWRKTALESVSKKVSTPPSVENTRILETLRMRKNVTPGEFEVLANQMADDYPSLSLLREIAGENNISIPVPTIEEMRTNIDEIADYSIKMLNGKGSEYERFAFFGDYDNTLFDGLLEEFDSTKFTASIKAKRTLSTDEAKVLENLFFTVPTSEMSAKVHEAAKSPAIRSLIEASEEYSKYLSTDDVADGNAE